MDFTDLYAKLTRRKDKYTSAAPRCTCLPPRKLCIGVALGDPSQTPQQCWLELRTSTPRLRLGVLASLLVNIALKLHSEEDKYISAKSISAKSKSNSAAPRWTWTRLWWTWPRCTCPPPCATSDQVHLGQVEVQLGFASSDFNLASMDLIGVCDGSPRATPTQVHFGQVEVQLGFASLDFNLTSMDLSPSRWSPCPVTDGLNIKFKCKWKSKQKFFKPCSYQWKFFSLRFDLKFK